MMRMTSRPAIWPASLVAWRCASLKYAGTVITAWVTVSPRYDSAVSFIFCRMKALIWLGDQALAVLGEGDERRRGPRAFRVLDDLGLAPIHHSHAAVGGPEVDTDY